MFIHREQFKDTGNQVRNGLAAQCISVQFQDYTYGVLVVLMSRVQQRIMPVIQAKWERKITQWIIDLWGQFSTVYKGTSALSECIDSMLFVLEFQGDEMIFWNLFPKGCWKITFERGWCRKVFLFLYLGAACSWVFFCAFDWEEIEGNFYWRRDCSNCDLSDDSDWK